MEPPRISRITYKNNRPPRNNRPRNNRNRTRKNNGPPSENWRNYAAGLNERANLLHRNFNYEEKAKENMKAAKNNYTRRMAKMKAAWKNYKNKMANPVRRKLNFNNVKQSNKLPTNRALEF